MGKGAPTQGALTLGSPTLELFVTIAATTVASAMLGLLLSAVAKSNEQIMPLLVVAVMSQLVFSGGMIPVTDRLVLDSFVGHAGPLGFRGIGLDGGSDEWARAADAEGPHWNHTAGAWWFDMGMLAGLSIRYLSFVRWKIRLKSA